MHPFVHASTFNFATLRLVVTFKHLRTPRATLRFSDTTQLLAITMALRIAPSLSFLQAFLPIAQAALRPTARLPLLHRWQPSLLPAITIPIPSVIGEIWDSVLKAVPKKKTSHMKKRHRQMAGKALKDVTALNTCSSCGRQKRAHVLCPYCVASKTPNMCRELILIIC